VHRDAGGLVQHQKVVVLEDDIQRAGGPRPRLRLLVRDEKLDPVARARGVFRRRALAVKPHGVFAEKLPYVADVKALLEVILEPLGRFARGNHDLLRHAAVLAAAGHAVKIERFAISYYLS
jgi:hypothetical protein